MRFSTFFGSALVASAVCFAVDANAQSIKVGKLKQLTAPFSGSNLDLLAIGYDGDTTESEEKPSLYGVNGQGDLSGDEVEVSWAWIETVKPSNDCLTCELRDPKKELAYTDHFADIRQY